MITVNSDGVKLDTMKLKDPKISILIGSESTTIEIKDFTSSITFVKVTLSPEQLSQALSRLSYTSCECEVRDLALIGKRMEHKKHQFEIPNDLPYSLRSEVLPQLIKETLPEGWQSDDYFNSQDTFFKKDGKEYAQTTIRRWVNEETNQVS